MNLSRRVLLGTAVAAALPVSRGRAQAPTIKIGVLSDQSGPYRDLTGPTSVGCCRQAVEDFDPANRGFNVEILSADHQNRPDIGLSIVRHWFDQEGLDVVTDVASSSMALGIQSFVKDRNKVYIDSGSVTARLTGDQCSPNMLHWTFDTYMLSRSTGGAVIAQGGDSWYFITADYAAGHQVQKDTTSLVENAGGKVLGASAYPFPETTDFSAFLLKAQNSGAKVLGLANGGFDAQNCIKQAAELGITRKMKIAALTVHLPGHSCTGP